MATVNVSLDTKTRQMVLVVDGMIVPFKNMNMGKYVNYDGVEEAYFEYTTEVKNSEGFVENRRFYLPSIETGDSVSNAKIDERGLASASVRNDTKVAADMITFFKNRHK